MPQVSSAVRPTKRPLPLPLYSQDTHKWTLLHQMQTLRILPIVHNHRHPKYYSKKEEKLVEPTNLQKAVTFQIFRNTGLKSTSHLSCYNVLITHTHTHTQIFSLSWNSWKLFLILRLVIIVAVNFYDVFSQNSCFPTRYFGRSQACISLVRFTITSEARKVK